MISGKILRFRPRYEEEGMADCPCGSGRSYAECCGPIIRGTVKAKTAEALMRARYSAFAKEEIDFLTSSLHPKARADHNPDEVRAWARSATWLGFEIKALDAGTEKDDQGFVEFVARYKVQDKVVHHHERAEFAREEDEWQFVDGKTVAQVPLYRDEPKVGRNDPCPCGSGKKYKKCCLLKEA
jgi:SEC-C motif-containing protein